MSPTIPDLRSERAARHWTREDLARATAGTVTVRTIAGIEAGEHTPRRSTVALIASALRSHPVNDLALTA